MNNRSNWINETKGRFPSLFRDMESCDFAVGEGWKTIIEALCRDLDSMHIHSLRVVRIKEKFGCLRFYVKGAEEQPHVYDRIYQAEVQAATTCEQCGKPGKPGRFLLTLCPSCLRQYIREARDAEG